MNFPIESLLKTKKIKALNIKKFRKIRKQCGFTQGDIARRAKMATSYVCDIELGNKDPSERTSYILARALSSLVNEWR